MVGSVVRRILLATLVIMCAAPTVSASVDTRGTVETPVLIEGSGVGILQHTATRMDWYPRTLPEGVAVTVAEGARIVVTMRETTTVVANPGGPRYTHEKSEDPRVVGEFFNARLDLTALGIRSRWILAENGICVSQTLAQEHFSIAPPKPIDPEGAVGNASAQSWERFFDRRGDDLQLAQQSATTRGKGDFSFYVVNSTFAVESQGRRTAFEAAVEDQAPSSLVARVTTSRAYIIDVYDGQYDTARIGGRTEVRANLLEVELKGSIVAEAVHGTVATSDGDITLDGARLDLSGHILSTIRSRMTDDASLLRMEFQEDRAGFLPQNQLPGLGGAADAWALPLSVGGVLAVAGVAAITYRPLRHRLAPAAQPVPEASKPAPPADLTKLAEEAYRADPGNVQRAMELAFHYANANRHEDALPLLLMTVRQFPKSDVARYATALALLHSERVEEAIGHLEYAFRLNPLNVARFVKEGPANLHGSKPEVAGLLSRWARVYHESNSRGYA